MHSPFWRRALHHRRPRQPRRLLRTVSPSPTATPTPGATGNTLLNISTRASAGTGQNVLIGGFILGEGDGPKRVIVRAIGPSLAAAGVTAALADPSLQLVDSTGQSFGHER